MNQVRQAINCIVVQGERFFLLWSMISHLRLSQATVFVDRPKYSPSPPFLVECFATADYFHKFKHKLTCR